MQTSIAVKELDAASQKIKEMTIDTMTVIAVLSLHDEFDFGRKRCQRLLDRMSKKADSIISEMATWQDYIQCCQDEMGMELKIRINE